MGSEYKYKGMLRIFQIVYVVEDRAFPQTHVLLLLLSIQVFLKVYRI